MQWLLKALNLIGDQPIRTEYSQLIARQLALTRVANYLQQPERFPEVDPELYRGQKTFVAEQLARVEEQRRSLLQDYPQLQEVVTEQFQSTLLDIEADTYAELIRSGRLTKNLALVSIETIDGAKEAV
jgi:CPA1 family monovalent cation:H+ antiporter